MGAVISGLLEGLEVPPGYTVSEWANLHMMLPDNAAEPGRYRSDRAPYQAEPQDTLLDPHVHTIVWQSSAQVGKGLALDTPLPTPHGWTSMGDVRLGDELYDETGSVCRVTFVSDVRLLPCYRVTFSDGASVVCDKDHLWTVDDGEGAGVRRTLGVEDLAEGCNYVRSGKVRNRYAVPVTKAISGRRSDLLLDPYLFGYWLGDGNSDVAALSVGDADLAHVEVQILNAGHRYSVDRKRTCNRVVIDPGKGNDGTSVKFGFVLGFLGLYRHGKCIPRTYLRAEVADRLALLQGIMDSDGHVTKRGRCEITLSNAALAADVCELLGTLGIKHTAREKTVAAVVNGVPRPCGTAWRISFLAYADRPVFRMARKVSRLPARTSERRQSETDRRRIVSVERVAPVPTRCIQVDSSSHLFLCSRWFVPTHNTQFLLNVIGYCIHHKPAPMMMIQPTIEMGEAFVKDKLDTAIAATPVLAERVAAEKSRSGGNTKRYKSFPGGSLTINGANSPTSLRMRSLKFVLADEVDAYPAVAGQEGDPVKLAARRTQTFKAVGAKLLQTSTPTLKGLSRIAEAYEKSDQRRFFVPCPECGTEQYLVWDRVVWTKGKPDTAAYACADCGCLWPDHEIKAAVRKGRWIATAAFSGTAGFHIWAIYSPWASLPEIVREYEDAEGKPAAMQEFWNGVLGEAYDGDQAAKVTVQELLDRRETFPKAAVPRGACVLTAGVDVQGDRLEVLIKAYGADGEAWILDHLTIWGAPESDPPWAELAEILMVRLPHPSGRHLGIEAAAIDSGFMTQRVYAFSARHVAVGRRWWAIKGEDGEGKPAWKKSDMKLKGGLRLFIVGTYALKDEIFGRLGIAEPGPGFLHIPEREPFDEPWMEQLIVEKVRTVYDAKGYPRREYYKPPGKRNEALDLNVYADAAHKSLNINHAARLREMFTPTPTADVSAVAKLFTGG